MSLPARLAPALTLALLVAVPASSTTIRVPADQPTIQSAVNAANAGDTVLVAPGTYVGTNNKNIDFAGKAVALVSMAGAELTVIDCERAGRGFNFHQGETSAALVDGFTVRNGFTGVVGGAGFLFDASSPTVRRCVIAQNEADLGAGMVCGGTAAPFIEDCIFRGNIGFSGAGIYTNANPRVVGCEFIENQVSQWGGAMYCGTSAPEITDCSFLRNSAEHGGGVVCAESTPTFTRCEFTENAAHHDKFVVNGGGMMCFSASPILINCVFTRNTAQSGGPLSGGGGLGAWESSVITMTGCTFVENRAGLSGGGVICDYGATANMTRCAFIRNSAPGFGGGVGFIRDASPTLEECTFWGNEGGWGGGLSAGESPMTVSRCTFYDNSGFGSALSVWSAPATVDRCIIAWGRGGPAVSCDQAGASVSVICGDIHANEGGDWVDCLVGQGTSSGNFSADPRFCAPNAGNFTLAANSPCLPGNHPGGADCGVIGVLGEACPPTAVREATWGAIKARFEKAVRPD